MGRVSTAAGDPSIPRLAGELLPGGILIASGIYVDREAAVQVAFESAGLTVKGRLAEGDWVAIEASKERHADRR